jgi:hypothetical protein
MSSSASHLEALLATVQLKHRCKATHLESVPVKEEAEGQTVWTGWVEVFELADHEGAKRCYAWAGMPDEARHQFVTVLQKGLVISPESAVKAWLASRSVTIHPVVKEKLSPPGGPGVE